MDVPIGGILYIGSPNPKLRKVELNFGEYGVLEVSNCKDEPIKLRVGEKKPSISGVFD